METALKTALAAYVLGAVVTFGHAFNTINPRIVGSALYWSVRAWA